MLKLYTYAVAQLSTLRKDEKGVTAIEYGLIAGAIAVAIIAVLLALGGSIENMFQKTADTLNSTAAGSS